MKRVFMALLLSCAFVSGCDTLKNYRTTSKHHDDYLECVKECERFENDSFKEKCKYRCFSKFDWSKSPLLDHLPDLGDRNSGE
jgi:hypothetical protein